MFRESLNLKYEYLQSDHLFHIRIMNYCFTFNYLLCVYRRGSFLNDNFNSLCGERVYSDSLTFRVNCMNMQKK